MIPEAMKGALFAKQMLTPDEVDRLNWPTNHDEKRQESLHPPEDTLKGMRAFEYFIDCLQNTSEEKSHSFGIG